tara:strand:+ start:2435 stop:3589 length:1155 start_codon:yes stop_codon:yes gene_type:complete
MKKVIEYLKLPEYWAQVEQIQSPELNKKPFVIGSFFTESKTVMEVSGNAKKEGIKKGMPLVEAKAIVPSLEIVSPNFDLYENVFEKLKNLLQKRYPLIESEASKGVYIDYSGLKKIYGDQVKEGLSIQKEIKNSFRLDSYIGASETKFVSRLASDNEKFFIDNKESFIEIKRNQVHDFLAPWPVEVVPGIKENLGRNGAHEVCRDLNLYLINDLIRLPKEFLQIAFGEKRAELIYACIHGRDFRLVRPKELNESVSRLVNFDEPTNDYLIIMSKVNLSIEELKGELILNNRFADSCVVLFRYSDYSKKEINIKLNKLKNNHKVLTDSIQKILRSRRLGIKDILIRFNGLQEHSTQLHLFEDVFHNQQLKSFILKPENKFLKKIS